MNQFTLRSLQSVLYQYFPEFTGLIDKLNLTNSTEMNAHLLQKIVKDELLVIEGKVCGMPPEYFLEFPKKIQSIFLTPFRRSFNFKEKLQFSKKSLSKCVLMFPHIHIPKMFRKTDREIIIRALNGKTLERSRSIRGKKHIKDGVVSKELFELMKSVVMPFVKLCTPLRAHRITYLLSSISDYRLITVIGTFDLVLLSLSVDDVEFCSKKQICGIPIRLLNLSTIISKEFDDLLIYHWHENLLSGGAPILTENEELQLYI
nr:hypothetical protein [Abalone asfa-like virus]